MSDSQGDVVVVGAGVIGLAVAFELVERGADVRIYDRQHPGAGASWAAAGMLAPYTEGIHQPELLRLCASSLEEYPAFVARVVAASGIDPRLRLDGVVHAAFDAVQLDALRRLAHELEARAVPHELLDRSSLLAAEPWLGSAVVGGLEVLGEGCIDNRLLGRALVAACETRGARVVRGAGLRLECDSRRALGVHSELGYVGASAVVNACGAWATALAGVPPQCLPPVEPIKGQMLALAAPAGFVRRPTWMPGVYAVPREDGRLLVGATVESAGFDQRVTAEGVHALLDAALAAAPALAEWTLTETWAGLRPSTPDGLPFLGPTPLERLFLATGHYRNGILLAPATARLIADAIEGHSAPLEPFALGRLGTEWSAPGRITYA